MAKKIPSEMSKLKSKISKPQSLRVLVVEDSEDDMLLIIRELKKGGYNPVYERVETATAMEKALKEKQWDIILCDHKLPKFNAPSAIAVLKKTNIDIPLIIVSGAIGEQTAVECMRLGAQDYIMKNNLSRLCPAINRELEEAKIRNKQKQTEEALSESEALYRKLFDNHAAVKLMIDPDTGNIIDANDAAANFYGWSREKLKQMKIQEINTLSPEEVKKELEKARTQKRIHFEFRHRRADGSIRNVEVFSSKIEAKGKDILHSIIHDITERKQAEEELRKSEARYRLLADNMTDTIWLMDMNLSVTYNSPSVAKKRGYTDEEIKQIPLEKHVTPESFNNAMTVFPEEIVKAKADPSYLFKRTLELEFYRKDGTKFWSENTFSLIRDENGIPISILGEGRDITERKHAEEALRKSEERYKTLFDEALVGICLADVETGIIIDCNEALAALVCKERAELIGRPQNILHPPQDNKKALSPTFKQHLTDKEGLILETQVVTRTGDIREVEIKANLLDLQGRKVLQGLFNDITERKQAEESLRRSEEKYRNLVENAQEGIYQSTLAGGHHLIVNRAYANMLGYESPEEIIQTITDIAQQLYVNPQDREKLLEMVNEKGSVAHFETELYKKDGSRIWVSVNMHVVRDDQGRILYYQGMVQDITDRKKMEIERHENIERLRKALGATVQSISRIVEMRDPYTEGHQRRVSDLARSMATEMGLSADRRDFIRTASSIHDIGKMAIPSEILSKPTKLTDLEFSLIKTHSQSGYDILKDVKFPWPVADVVLQHHERMDGSGYPQGLKGDDILLEARILAIADVVEAIASHRPYRPALEIDIALEEISRNKGMLYDADAVDACLKLFREKGYTLVLKNR